MPTASRFVYARSLEVTSDSGTLRFTEVPPLKTSVRVALLNSAGDKLGEVTLSSDEFMAAMQAGYELNVFTPEQANRIAASPSNPPCGDV